MNVIKRMIDFVDNGGRVNKELEPKLGEPFYADYVKQKIKRDFSIGDRIKLTKINHDGKETEIEGLLLETKYYDIEILTSGHKEWKSAKNKSRCDYEAIKDITLIEKVSNNFELSKVCPDKIQDTNVDNDSNEQIRINQLLRKIAEEKFNSVYPNIDFDHSHIISYDCNLFFPFPYDSITADVLISVMGEKPIHVSCKTGNICQNANVSTAYNYIEKESGLMVAYAYLPDGKYENIVISCLWTINAKVDGKNKISILSMDLIDKLDKIQNKRNIYYIHRNAESYLSFGSDLFKAGKSQFLVSPLIKTGLERMMQWDSYFVMNPTDNIVKFIKSPEKDNTGRYIDLAALTYLHSNCEDIKNMPQKNIEVLVKHHDILPGCLSWMENRGEFKYLWKMIAPVTDREGN